MPSLNTVYRAIVMIAAGVIVVKGWQFYGPTTEQVKTFAVAALEKAQDAWSDSQQEAADPVAVGDPRALIPQMPGTVPAIVAEVPAPALVAITPAPETLVNSTGPVAAASESNGAAPLLTRLQEMGGANAQVGPWGASGQLYRCCCRAKLAETSPMARHFEAVAGEPVVAVEQVVAKVEAWRTEQQSLLR